MEMHRSNNNIYRHILTILEKMIQKSRNHVRVEVVERKIQVMGVTSQQDNSCCSHHYVFALSWLFVVEGSGDYSLSYSLIVVPRRFHEYCQCQGTVVAHHHEAAAAVVRNASTADDDDDRPSFGVTIRRLDEALHGIHQGQ